MCGNVTGKNKIMENLLKAEMENFKQPSTWEKGGEYIASFCKLPLYCTCTDTKTRLFVRVLGKGTILRQTQLGQLKLSLTMYSRSYVFLSCYHIIFLIHTNNKSFFLEILHLLLAEVFTLHDIQSSLGVMKKKKKLK